MAVDPIKYNQLPTIGTLEAGDTVLGEKVNGITGRLNVAAVAPADGSITYAKIQNVTTDKLLGRVSSGSGVVEEVTCTDFAQSLLDDTTASDARTTLGLGTLATQSGTFSGTSSGTNTGDQNTFGTIAVSGQNNVVADAATDTLTLVAGTNVTITTDASTDAITINASGGTPYLEYVDTQTVTGNQATFTNIGDWAEAIFVFEGLNPTTTNSFLTVRTSSNNGVSYDSGSSDYGWQQNGYMYGVGAVVANDYADIWIVPTGAIGADANESLYGELRLFTPARTNYHHFTGTFSYSNGGSPAQVNLGGYRLSSSAVNAVQISFGQGTTLGTIGGGSIHLYKLNRGA